MSEPDDSPIDGSNPDSKNEPAPTPGHHDGEHLPQISASSPGASAEQLQPSSPKDPSGQPSAGGGVPKFPFPIGQYTVKGLIGKSNFQVFLAHDEEHNRYVAIKVFNLNATISPEREHALKKEAEKLCALDNQNIVKFYDYEGPDPKKGNDIGSNGFIVMEYIDGETLENLFAREPRLPLNRMVSIMVSVARGVDAAHKQGVVHRDLKPANILIARDGKPKVCDFDLAADEDAKQSGNPALHGA